MHRFITIRYTTRSRFVAFYISRNLRYINRNSDRFYVDRPLPHNILNINDMKSLSEFTIRSYGKGETGTYSIKTIDKRNIQIMTKVQKTVDEEKISRYMEFLEFPLKLVGCWDWFERPTKMYHISINNIYLALVLFMLANVLMSLFVYLYTEWVDLMSNLDKVADGLPLLASLAIVSYFAVHKKELYEIVYLMNSTFKWRSGRGLTNMTMLGSYRMARNFAYFYTSSTVLCVAIYVFLPVLAHWWSQQPLEPWIYLDATHTTYLVILFLRQCIAQAFVALAMGQLGVFYVSTSILLCGQLDLLCCSLRNARYTALLAEGVCHTALVERDYQIREDEKHNYLYNTAQMTDSKYHYDAKVTRSFNNTTTQFDIYSSTYDSATEEALRDCARVFQAINALKEKFECFVSPILVLRIAQVTLYHCTLLYAVTLKFDMVTVEYLGAVVLDIFVYCYFGNQIILQADRVSTAAYQSEWASAGRRGRSALLGLLQAARRPLAVRAAHFLPMDLRTFLLIIKTSFSYYTLLVSVNEK